MKRDKISSGSEVPPRGMRAARTGRAGGLSGARTGTAEEVARSVMTGAIVAWSRGVPRTSPAGQAQKEVVEVGRHSVRCGRGIAELGSNRRARTCFRDGQNIMRVQTLASIAPRPVRDLSVGDHHDGPGHGTDGPIALDLAVNILVVVTPPDFDLDN